MTKLTKVEKNNLAVDIVCNKLCGAGYAAEKTGNYGGSQIYVSDKHGLMRYSVKVVCITKNDYKPAQFIVPTGDYDIMAAVLLDENGQSLSIALVDSDNIDTGAYTFTARRYGRLDKVSVPVASADTIFAAKLPKLVADLTATKGKEAKIAILASPITDVPYPKQLSFLEGF